MESDSYEQHYYSDSDESVDQMEEQPNSDYEVETHVERKTEAYDRYMDMLLKRAYDIVIEDDDSESTDDED